MKTTPGPLPDPFLSKLPHPEEVRRAIDAVDRKARLLRRLLRLSLCVHSNSLDARQEDHEPAES